MYLSVNECVLCTSVFIQRPMVGLVVFQMYINVFL